MVNIDLLNRLKKDQTIPESWSSNGKIFLNAMGRNGWRIRLETLVTLQTGKMIRYISDMRL